MKKLLYFPAAVCCDYYSVDIGYDLFETDTPVDSLSNPLRRVFLGRLTYPAGKRPAMWLVI